jgi:hypothetical protein
LVTGRAFYQFLTHLAIDNRLPKGFSVLNPYVEPGVQKLLRRFCDTFYKGSHPRTLVLGINPGRLGAGITGIPFTDPVALEECCGIKNTFEKRAELSSSFVYRFIDAYGGAQRFYSEFLISSVCPLGFLRLDKNANYYDDPKLLGSLTGFMDRSLIAHLEFNINTRNLIVFGKRNAEVLQGLRSFQQMKFANVVVLEHPRYVMQYRRKETARFVAKFITALKKTVP